MTTMALVGLVGLLVLAIIGDWLPLGNPEAVGAGPRLAPPTPEFPAGTDELGRSELPRLVQGLRTTFLIATCAVLLTSVVSIAAALISAYFKGLVGELIVRAADVLFSFPSFLLAILISAITGPGLTGAVIAIVLVCAPLMIRTVRAAALSVVNRDFVLSARVGGTRAGRTILVHLLPNVAGAAIVQATYSLSVGMLIESGLSFLGLGVQPPLASLGSLVFTGSVYLSIAPWLVLFPGILLALTILAVNLVGDGLRDLFDVRGAEVRR